jgi:hypothetical protein
MSYGIIMELDTLFDLMADLQQPDPNLYLGTNFEEYLRTHTNPAEYADQILLNLPPPRVNYYETNDYDYL